MAIDDGILSRPKQNWSKSFTFDFPEQLAIDEDKKAKAVERKIASGQMTYEAHYGPDWADHFEQMALEQKKQKELGLIFPAFVSQTVEVKEEDEEIEEGEENAN